MAWKTMIEKIRFDQTGGTAVEYGLMLAVIVIAMLIGLEAFATSANDVWEYVRQAVVAVMGT